MKKILLTIVLLFTAWLSPVQAAPQTDIYFFYGKGCPHCAKEELFLDKLENKDKNLDIHRYEVWGNQANAKLLGDVGRAIGLKVSGVPVTVIGQRAIVGFASEETTGEEIKKILSESNSLNRDVVNEILTGKDVANIIASTNETDLGDKKISTPFGSEIRLGDFSLPLLTVIIGLLDSLNPCAMWVLLFLIGIILSMEDRKKMWLLGTVFIGASAAAYFVFLAAWLNIYQMISYIAWINGAVALVAIIVGLFNVWDFWVNRNGGCDISGNPTKRKIIMNSIKNFALNKSFFVALVGLAVIGAAVNLVELLCSAGLPAVYIPILTMAKLPQLNYYIYLLVYVFFYILIQIVVFLIAMFTLRQVAVGSRFTRWFGLAGGILMILVGIYIFVRPDIGAFLK